ncbi:hypothetical protein GLOIN_2v1780192 [Rhizophagus irregularis DAOM 181602=DAOM 197198]|nr:hypothetical protein RirG_187080 [Rhizophagus irregularis DAOM 197198w]GBC51443.1 hypothetical protein GLOIN_2v1780192 [Rhizophagus irregularis DAOM 181602=DAOM 197198]
MSNSMEWKKINIEAIQDLKDKMKIDGMKKFNEWMQKKNDYFLLGKKIISLAEQNEILLEYIMLNNDFTKRLKNENRYQDNKEKTNIRIIISIISKPWLIKDNNSMSKIKDENKNKEEETKGKEITETEKASSSSSKKKQEKQEEKEEEAKMKKQKKED